MTARAKEIEIIEGLIAVKEKQLEVLRSGKNRHGYTDETGKFHDTTEEMIETLTHEIVLHQHTIEMLWKLR